MRRAPRSEAFADRIAALRAAIRAAEVLAATDLDSAEAALALALKSVRKAPKK